MFLIVFLQIVILQDFSSVSNFLQFTCMQCIYYLILFFSNPNTFWLSTGSFPQEIIISFPSMIAMETILLRCSKGNTCTCTCMLHLNTSNPFLSVARLRVERSEDVSMGNFQAVTEKGINDDDDDDDDIFNIM